MQVTTPAPLAQAQNVAKTAILMTFETFEAFREFIFTPAGAPPEE